MVVALANIAGLQKVASFTLNNLYRPGDTIHTTYVEDTGTAGELPCQSHCQVVFVTVMCKLHI